MRTLVQTRGSELECLGRLPKGTDSLPLSTFEYCLNESVFSSDATNECAESSYETSSTFPEPLVEVQVLHEELSTFPVQRSAASAAMTETSNS